MPLHPPLFLFHQQDSTGNKPVRLEKRIHPRQDARHESSNPVPTENPSALSSSASSSSARQPAFDPRDRIAAASPKPNPRSSSPPNRENNSRTILIRNPSGPRESKNPSERIRKQSQSDSRRRRTWKTPA
ncbi:hypothetical protein ACJRO7_009303 [Eucalyptus globulus]|uniref:Uncharacterized protein n=1 Tax=Eucalyptus globulus TaxID=34317 RepID=A0ABD3LDU8_EUCGL